MIEIIPAIDLIDGRCVRLSQGDYERCTQYKALPEEMVKMYADAGIRRVHVVDLDGAKAAVPRNLHVLERMASLGVAAIEWGGGLKSDEDRKMRAQFSLDVLRGVNLLFAFWKLNLN